MGSDPINCTAQAVFEASKASLLQIPGITQKQSEVLLTNRSLESAKRLLDICEKGNIHLLPISSPLYPPKAKCFKDTPILLYYKGHLKPLDHSVGIVGARRCTQSDKEMVRKLTEELVIKEYPIVSGMAKGIDSYAHTACLQNDGYTIAVLGCGVDICYPAEHDKLMKEISERGLLLSEYPPGTKPSPYHFPLRNRIISSWSDELYVVAASKNSGALITADYSKQLGRAVCII